ncbi:AAA family ATPase [Aromatoleum bremense]|uniref:AAA family ATPase n=1 Tax=Aromatoleum bremense TaxID=76115 RepID=A0ABX1NYA0_9RHOO|nr:AAA family ATPase [Aromatoleum bremense]NMG16642.1 AAA family ATPase [Aromatoleum bremense]QTQ33525.1 Putative ATP-binding protein [Aromatoleum bremense]
MHVDALRVENFRCFVQETFEFQSGFNLLVGVNGSGKTSLLKAVAAGLATPINGLGKSAHWPHAEEANARLVLIELQGRVRYERCYPVRIELEGEVCGSARSWWVEQPGPGSQAKFEHTVFSAIADESARIAQGGQGALPLAAFYAAERQWRPSGVGADTAVRHQDSRLDAYASWYDAALDMKGLETWVIGKSLERLETESGSRDFDNGGALDELALVNRAVALAIPGAKGLRYDIRYRRLVLDWQDGDPVPFEILSDGQRALTALVADIARRACLLNPQLGARVLDETPGVVLIDELDMHLHPAWQRRVCGVLKTAFPCIQFIAASHSPQIIGELMADEILLMKGGKVVGHPERALGLPSSEVLAEIMGTEPQNAEVAEALRGDCTGGAEVCR